MKLVSNSFEGCTVLFTFIPTNLISMYLSHIKLENFRIFQDCSIDLLPGLNLIAGENDAGKTALMDAIKMTLGTLSNDWSRVEHQDFYNGAESFSIVCILKNISQEEAAYFLEWLSFDDDGSFYLKITYRARKLAGGKAYSTVYAGADEDGGVVQGEAKERLRVTYLKPLRDAEFELTPKRNSRFSQILDSFHTFQDKDSHPLVTIMQEANEAVRAYFATGSDGAVVQDVINDDYLANFSLSHNPLSSKIDISSNRLKSILEKLELSILNRSEDGNLGLGSNNLLFIAAEMLLLKKENDYKGLKLALIEEIEAHLHPQSQLNLIDFLEKQSETLGFQSILTTHSSILASKVDIQKIIICKRGCAYSLHSRYTKLEVGDYEFLRRFLDSTKANLFFANGVVMVEGDAENLFLPILAELIGRPLYKFGVSIVNVSNTALLRYARIFQRKDDRKLGIPVACIADRDVPPKEAGEYQYTLLSGKNAGQTRTLIDRKTEDDYDLTELAAIENKIFDKYSGGDVKVYYTGTWTLEYEVAKSCLRKYLHQAITLAIESSALENEIDTATQQALDQRCVQEITAWEANGDSLEKIAVTIYAPLVRKQASKAVVAQLLAQKLLADKAALSAATIRSDIYIKYLVDAIDYVTTNATND